MQMLVLHILGHNPATFPQQMCWDVELQLWQVDPGQDFWQINSRDGDLPRDTDGAVPDVAEGVCWRVWPSTSSWTNYTAAQPVGPTRALVYACLSVAYHQSVYAGKECNKGTQDKSCLMLTISSAWLAYTGHSTVCHRHVFWRVLRCMLQSRHRIPTCISALCVRTRFVSVVKWAVGHMTRLNSRVTCHCQVISV